MSSLLLFIFSLLAFCLYPILWLSFNQTQRLVYFLVDDLK
jgi:nitrate reductase NapE component